MHKAWNSKGEMPYCFPRSSIKFQGHTVQNITGFDPNWAFPDYRPVAAFKSLRFALFVSTEEVWWRHSIVQRPSLRLRGFGAFYGECIERMAWNSVCWCILTTLILVMVCWFSYLWCNFNFLGISWRTYGSNGLKFGMLRYPDYLDLVKWVSFGGSWAFYGECMERMAWKRELRHESCLVCHWF